MKICLFAGTLICLLASQSSLAQEKRKAADPPCNCPLFELEYYPPQILYYCDYFALSCQDLTGAGFHFSEEVVCPYVACGGDCYAPSRGPKKKEDDDNFGGRDAKVRLDYMHKATGEPSQRGPREGIGWGVNQQRNAHFVKFMRDSREVQAKVLEFRFNRPLATKKKGLTDVEIDSHWESRFVAFEVESDPAHSGYTVHSVAEAEPIGDNRHAWRGRVELERGKSAHVLILLAKDPPTPKVDAEKKGK